MRVTLENRFHNTEVNINVPANGRLSKHQTKRVRRELCGIDECLCPCPTNTGPFDVELVWSHEEECEVIQVTEHSNDDGYSY